MAASHGARWRAVSWRATGHARAEAIPRGRRPMILPASSTMGKATSRWQERNITIAKKLGVKPMQTALAWVLAHPAVTAPIIGASKLSHLDDALGALDITLSAEDKASMEEPYTPHPVLGF